MYFQQRSSPRRSAAWRPGASRPRRLGMAGRRRRRAADVVDPHRRQDLARDDVQARLRAAVDDESGQPAARAERPDAGRVGQRRDAVRADVGRRRQLQQRLRHRQRHRLHRLEPQVRRDAPGPDRQVSGRNHRRAGAHREPDAGRRGRGAGLRRRSRAAAQGYRSLLGEPGEGVPVEARGGRAAGAPPAAGTPPPAVRRRRLALRRRPALAVRRAAGSRRSASCWYAAGGWCSTSGRCRCSGAARVRPARRRLVAAVPVAAAVVRRRPAFPVRRRSAAAGSAGRQASPTRSRVTACCTCSDCRRAKTSSGRPSSCRPTPSGRTRSPSTRRSTRRRAAAAARRPTPSGPSISASEAKPVVSWKNAGGARRRPHRAHAGRHDHRRHRTGHGHRRRQSQRDRRARRQDTAGQGLVHAAASAEFVTGPTILRHNDKDIVIAATKDGRVMLFDAASLGGANHGTPLAASNRRSLRRRHHHRGRCAGGLAGIDRTPATRRRGAAPSTSWRAGAGLRPVTGLPRHADTTAP